MPRRFIVPTINMWPSWGTWRPQSQGRLLRKLIHLRNKRPVPWQFAIFIHCLPAQICSTSAGKTPFWWDQIGLQHFPDSKGTRQAYDSPFETALIPWYVHQSQTQLFHKKVWSQTLPSLVVSWASRKGKTMRSSSSNSNQILELLLESNKPIMWICELSFTSGGSWETWEKHRELNLWNKTHLPGVASSWPRRQNKHGQHDEIGSR